ncbi:MAG: DUF2298 domain-containing protein [Actinomycetota bacterium]|nr:DUF2298 domain-containing protein [Actinomycetota bacterium]
MSDAVVFWALVELVGFLALPATGFLFSRLPGRGLALAKPVGLLLLAYPVWLLASVSLVSYGRAAAFGGLAFLAVLAVLVWIGSGRPRPRGVVLTLWLVGEVLFTVAFFAWALLRSYAPEAWGTERPMDMAFINAVNRADSFPPEDPWMSGETLNYYYFGHYVVAFLIRLTGVDPGTGYNLGVSLFYALVASAVFTVAATVVLAGRKRARLPRWSPFAAGLAAVVFAMVLGNLAGAVELLENPRPLAQYDWWSPTRIIGNPEDTANEFPFFTFLLGDLHAHAMATPFALTALAFALQLALRGPRLPTTARTAVAAAGELLLAALVLGSLYAVNTLDFPTAAVLVLGGLLLWVWRSGGRRRLSGRAVLISLAFAALLVGTALALFAPFLVDYSPATKGIALVRDREPFTRFTTDISLLYALPLWVIAAAVAHRLRMPLRYVVWGGVLLMVVLVLLAPDDLAGLVLVVTVAAVALHAALDRRLGQAERFFWLLVAGGLGLIGVADFVYIRDFFEGTSGFRFNTVFKTGYQAWFLLSIAAACGVFLSRRWLRRPLLRAWQAGLVAVAALLAIYPVAAPYARTVGFSREPTLDGARWLAETNPDDAAAIRWLRRNVSGTPTILEAFGDDFSFEGHGRVSTYTGLPTVIGWAGHEAQWGHDAGSRPQDVETIYTTRDARTATSLLRRYGVRYVFVGSLERADYPAAGLAKFRRIGRPVFTSGATTVYELPT